MQSDYQKLQAELNALQREVERLKEIELERQRSQDRLQFLLDLVSDLDLDLTGILHRILERLPEVLRDADFGIVYMYDPATGFLVPQACMGADETVLQQIRLRPGESISGHVFQTGQAQLSTAAELLRSAVATMTPENQALLMEGTAYVPQPASNICVPLRTGDRILGTLTVSSSQAVYTPDDLALLEGMAGQVSRVVANAQAFKAQAESEAKYRALVDNLPVAVSEATPDGEVLFFNDAALAINGYDRAELAALAAEDVYADPADRQRLAEALRERGHHAYELQTRHKDGRAIWIRGATRAIRGADGEIISYLGYYEDITDEYRQRHQERAVQRIRELVAAMEKEADIQPVLVEVRQAFLDRGLPFNACGINVVDDATNPPTVHFNAMLEDGEWIHSDAHGGSDIVLKFWRSGQVQYRRDLERDDPHGERSLIVRTMGRPIRSVIDIPFAYGTLALNSEDPDAFDEDDLAFLQVIQQVLDDSFRRLHDLRALDRKEEELRRAQKMEAIGHLAGGIAHDFNNMLTLVTGHASFLIEGLALHDQRRDEAIAIYMAADRCAKMVQQLLAFSSRQAAAPALTDVNAVIGESTKLLQRLIGENIELDLDLDPGAGTIYIDRGQLEQIVLNLVINGRDAIGGNGAIRLTTADDAVTDGAAAPFAIPPGDYTVIAVADTGAGMAPEVVEQIFDPFFTTKEAGQGTGLGLSTVYGIVRQNEGHIAVESAPGEGATFRIYFPHAAATDAAAAIDAIEPSRPQSGRETVLIVEDERALLRMARRQLERNGYTVLDAPDADAAFALLEDHPDIHLLLTDVVLAKGPSGIELARQFRQRRPGVPVLFMSGYTADHYEELEPGQLLPKPFTEPMLTAMVRTAIDRA